MAEKESLISKMWKKVTNTKKKKPKKDKKDSSPWGKPNGGYTRQGKENRKKAMDEALDT